MKNKKFFAKALAFAMVMGTVGVHGIAAGSVNVVKAAVNATADPVFDAEAYTVTLEAKNGEAYICLQILKDAKGEKGFSAEYWYPVDASSHKVTVDLSFLKATKKQYVRAYGVAGSESQIVEIAAQPKTVIKYDAKQQKFIDKSKKEIDDADLANYQYKTLYGSEWSTTDLTAANYKIADSVIAGTTIVVRLKADTTKKIPAGTEVKLKIAAAAKAPKVKVDYKKGSITLPKGVEIAVKADLKTAAAAADWKEVSGKLTQKELLNKAGITTDNDVNEKLKSGYTLYVRTKKTDKKAASNMAIITVKATPVLDTATTKTIINKSVASDTDKITYTTTDTDVTLNVAGNSVWAYSLDGGKKWTVIEGTSVKLDVKKSSTFKVYIPATEDSFASAEVEVTNPGA